MCLNPKWIYKKGQYKDDNYRGKKGQIYELGTFSKCGACSVCINEKANNWVVRNYYEEKANQKKCFITLTYRNNPIWIVRKDIQDFMKRLRRKITDRTGEELRVFYALEYGELNNRPHAHIILYGWEDENPQYLGINKKGNIIYKSKIIDKTWGLGRTSYQKFNDNEIPYIALYNTAKEEFKRGYKVTRETIKFMINYARKMEGKMEKSQWRNLWELIIEKRKILEDEKIKYTTVSECNGWSIALGWREFLNNWTENYVYVEYINDKEFVTPSPWVKKLANMGIKSAAEEMFRREKMIKQSANEDEEREKNKLKVERRKKSDMEKWQDTKKTIETL